MPRGEVQTEEFICLLNPISDVVTGDTFDEPITDDCCYELPIFGDLFDTNPLRNDKTRFYDQFEESTLTADMFLTKPSDPDFVEVALTDDSFGTFFEYGFFVDELSRKSVGFELDWVLILAAFGEGSYQLRLDRTTLLSPPDPDPIFDFQYCLGQYTARKAEGTMFLNFQNSKTLGDRFTQDNNVIFPHATFDESGAVLNTVAFWPDGIRVYGYFGYDNSDYEIEDVKFRDQSIRHTKQRQIERFQIRIDHAPSEVHEKIRTEFNQADFKSVTDYNRNAYKRHIETAVRNPSEYKPVIDEESLLAHVVYDLDGYWDFKDKKFCN